MQKTLLLCLFLFTGIFQSDASLLTTPLKDSLNRNEKTMVQEAFNDFRNLPASEKKARLKKAKKEIRAFKAARKKGMDGDVNTLVLVVLAIILPPVAVYLYDQQTSNRFWITLLLFLLGIAGAVLFSWLLIFAAVVLALLIVLGAV